MCSTLYSRGWKGRGLSGLPHCLSYWTPSLQLMDQYKNFLNNSLYLFPLFIQELGMWPLVSASSSKMDLGQNPDTCYPCIRHFQVRCRIYGLNVSLKFVSTTPQMGWTCPFLQCAIAWVNGQWPLWWGPGRIICTYTHNTQYIQKTYTHRCNVCIWVQS